MAVAWWGGIFCQSIKSVKSYVSFKMHIKSILLFTSMYIHCIICLLINYLYFANLVYFDKILTKIMIHFSSYNILIYTFHNVFFFSYTKIKIFLLLISAQTNRRLFFIKWRSTQKEQIKSAYNSHFLNKCFSPKSTSKI